MSSAYMNAATRLYRTPQPTAAEVKAAIDPLEFYRHHLLGARNPVVTWFNTGCCPLCGDSKSFFINARSGAFFCHACGLEGIDIIEFAAARNGVEYTEAVQQLAVEWGLE